MTTQREPDTSAEGLRRLADRLAASTDVSTAEVYSAVSAAEAALRTLADAAGQAAPVPPLVEGPSAEELRVAKEDVAFLVAETGRLSKAFEEGFHHKMDAIARAEGLAKEVERLKANLALLGPVTTPLTEKSDGFAVTIDREEYRRLRAAEAKLAVYEAPIGDFTTTAEERAQWLRMASDNIFQDEDLIRLSRDFARLSAAHAECKPAANEKSLADWSRLPRDLYVISAVERDGGIGFDATMCSVPMVTAPEVRYVRSDYVNAASKAECKGENTKLREALGFYADKRNWWNRDEGTGVGWHNADLTGSLEIRAARIGTFDTNGNFFNDAGRTARAALAPASEEKSDG